MSNLTYAQTLSKLSSDISSATSIISSAIGIPCNILSIIVFARLMMRNNKTNMGYLYIFQCSIDLIMLLFILLVHRSAQTFGVNFYLMSDTTCKLIIFSRRLIFQTSSWMTVLIAFDRFIFILYGHTDRFKFMKKRRNLAAIIFGVFIIISLANILNLFFYVSNSSCTSSNSIVVSSDIISILSRTYLPFIFTIVFNIFMVRKIVGRTNQARASLNQNSVNRKENYFTTAVIAYNIYFLVLSLPFSIYYVFYDANLYSGAFSAGSDAVFRSSYALVNSITGSLSFFVQTFSFFTYLTFNKLFRSELVHIVRKLLGIVGLAKVNPESTDSSSAKTNIR